MIPQLWTHHIPFNKLQTLPKRHGHLTPFKTAGTDLEILRFGTVLRLVS